MLVFAFIFNIFSLNLAEVFADIDDIINITRAEFNKLCEPLFNKIQTITQATLQESKLKPGDINEILLVGGSSRIPRIEELLTKMFPGKKMNKVIHPDEAVAYGAALCAQKYFESDSIEVQAGLVKVQEKLANMELVEAIPLGLGTDLEGGLIDFLIPRNNEDMLNKYNQNQGQIEAEAMRITVRENLKLKISQTLYKLNSNEIAPAKKQTIRNRCDEMLRWIEDNNGATEKQSNLQTNWKYLPYFAIPIFKHYS